MGNANLKPPPTANQVLGMQVCRIVAAIPSIIGATYIIQHVLRSPKRRQKTATRILLGMSLMDLLHSCVSACSSSIIPKELNKIIELASGNWATCEAFGFLGHGSSVSSALYNASLTLFYLLTIRNGWTETRVRKVEPFMHAVPLAIGWGTAIVGLAKDQFNPGIVGCSLEDFPWGCSERDDFPCLRGERSKLYQIVLFHMWIWSVFIFLVIAMTLIYLKIAQVNRASPSSTSGFSHSATSSTPTPPKQEESPPSKKTSSSQNNTPRLGRTARSKKGLSRLKQQFATQALLYCMAYAFTWFFKTLGFFLFRVFYKPPYVPILFLSIILNALPGFWNAFIYVRPRYIRYRRQQQQQQLEQEQQESLSTQSTQRNTFKAVVAAFSVKAEDDDEEMAGEDEDDGSQDDKRVDR